jgi:hypothetical protein
MDSNVMSSLHYKDSYRVTQQGKMVLNFSASKIFPLLCPVEEYKWLPGWECIMVYSKTGIAEKDAVFLTKEKDGSEIIWTVITYEPPKLIEFIMVRCFNSVERFSISLTEIASDITELEWKFMNTGYSKKSIEQNKNPDNDSFNAFLEERRKEMDYYLRTGKMIR